MALRILFLNQAPGHPLYEPKVIEEQLNSYASPGTSVELHFPDNFAGATNRNGALLKYLRVPTLAAKILWAAENGYDAVIQSNGYDPGVEAGRLAVRIPVIGLMRTAVHFALTLADRVGITAVGATERHVWTLLRSYGLDHGVTRVVAIPEALGNATQWYRSHAEEDKRVVFDRLVAAMKGLIDETGAELIVPLGGVIVPYLIDPRDLQEACGIQVLNTKAVAIRFAETCVGLGFTHSDVTYPHVPLTSDDFA